MTWMKIFAPLFYIYVITGHVFVQSITTCYIQLDNYKYTTQIILETKSVEWLTKV